MGKRQYRVFFVVTTATTSEKRERDTFGEFAIHQKVSIQLSDHFKSSGNFQIQYREETLLSMELHSKNCQDISTNSSI